MPTYEYSCTSCHRRTEAVQRFSDPPLTECEHCGGQLKRVFHPVGIVLKGSGFYATDSRSTKSLSPSTKESSSESTSSEKSGSDKPASTETKKDPAPKKDSGAAAS